MRQNFKEKIALMMSLVLMVMLILPATAVSADTTSYVALGDSISYGYSDWISGGYTVLYAQEKGYDLDNLSDPGDTTRDLINILKSYPNMKLIRSADVITISIGSNHLLGPFISAVTGLYGINPSDFPDDPTGQAMLAALAVAIENDKDNGDGIEPEDRLAWLMDLRRPEGQKLNLAWLAGTAAFALEWPAVLLRIRLLAPRAKVYVNNVYNPLGASVTANPELAPLYNLANLYISRINTHINRYKTSYRYQVIDVYGICKTNPSALSFNIPYALSIDGTTHFTEFFMACDPHPTTIGHQLIADALP